MPITLVYETHSTTLDNEAGIATGWLPGELSEEGLRQAVALGSAGVMTGSTWWSHRTWPEPSTPHE